VGVHHLVSEIIAIENTTQRFGANPEPDRIAIPMIRTVDDARAQPILAFLAVRMAFPIKQHDASTIGHYTLEWRAGRDSVVNMVDIHPHRNAGYYPQWVAKNMGITEKPDCYYPEDDVPDHLIFCTTNALVQIRGNGGGKWYNTWLHGNHMFREGCREVLIENTHEPLHFYHLHMQQQESAYHLEARGARHVNIYGIKCELKGGIAKFVNCAHVRVIGSGGLGTPDSEHGYECMFLFKDCTDFLISNISDDVNLGKSRWIGACYYRWINATLGSFHPIIVENGSSRFAINPYSRPIIYLQGTP
jgi:hypothetical protein